MLTLHITDGTLRESCFHILRQKSGKDQHSFKNGTCIGWKKEKRDWILQRLYNCRVVAVNDKSQGRLHKISKSISSNTLG